jgi:hypothetical protein
MQPRNPCSLTIENNSAQQSRRKLRIPWAIQNYLVFLLDLETGMREALRKLAIICNKKQTFGLGVKTSNVEELRKFCREQIKDRVVDVRIFSGRHEPGGLMQHDGKRYANADKFASYLHMIARPGLRAEICADRAVDRDSTCRD